jgi:hypothetical protein
MSLRSSGLRLLQNIFGRQIVAAGFQHVFERRRRKLCSTRHSILFLVRGGLVLELLYDGPKLFQRGGVLRAELLRWATRIGVLNGMEHLARERQWRAAMILLTDEVEFRPRRFVALEAIEPQKIVNFLGSVADNFRAVLVGV